MTADREHLPDDATPEERAEWARREIDRRWPDHVMVRVS